VSRYSAYSVDEELGASRQSYATLWSLFTCAPRPVPSSPPISARLSMLSLC